jgi:hypothetical protein
MLGKARVECIQDTAKSQELPRRKSAQHWRNFCGSPKRTEINYLYLPRVGASGRSRRADLPYVGIVPSMGTGQLYDLAFDPEWDGHLQALIQTPNAAKQMHVLAIQDVGGFRRRNGN